jgi:magnesium transporter
MDSLWDDAGWVIIFYRVFIMDNGYMEKLKNRGSLVNRMGDWLDKEELEDRLSEFEESIFNGEEVDLKEFYRLKKQLIDSEEHREMLELHMILETMLDKQQNDLMNKRLNLLTIWSTIFLPLSFYTGMWGMNFDDVPLLTGDHGFWVFLALTIITIVGMWMYFKKNRWI